MKNETDAKKEMMKESFLRHRKPQMTTPVNHEPNTRLTNHDPRHTASGGPSRSNVNTSPDLLRNTHLRRRPLPPTPHSTTTSLLADRLGVCRDFADYASDGREEGPLCVDALG